jgi:hypothetical protein
MADRLAIQAAIKRATNAAQRTMDQLDAEALAELEKLYRQAADDIAARIAIYSGMDGNVSISELKSVLAQIESRISDLTTTRAALLRDSLSSAAELGTRPFTDTAALDASAAMRINNEAVQFVRSYVASDGLQLSDRIWRLDRHARDTVVNAVEMAVVQGHGAAQAAREFMVRGESVPIEIKSKIDSANAAKIAKEVMDSLMTGSGSPLDNAMRLFRTEINRAHGESYIKGALGHPDAAGLRFLLSPGHPKPDICDLHATANLHGLGSGVYPSREKCPWPAHPNTLSYVEVVFRDEVNDADRDGKETPMQALAKLTPAQQIGVLGKNKHVAFKDGLLTQGMIKSPWSVVQKRIGDEKPQPKPIDKPPRRNPVMGLDDYIASGREISDTLLGSVQKDGAAILEAIHRKLKDARPIMTPARVQNNGKGADLVRAASQMFPDDWTKAADRHGALHVKYSIARGGYLDIPHVMSGHSYRRFYGFSGIAKGGEGFIRAGRFSTAVHEYTHRLQHALPALDDIFQTLHERRTAGDRLERLRDLLPKHGYPSNEVTKKDEYINVYQGRIYSESRYLGKHGALEVMTMAFENVLGGKADDLMKLVEQDREMFDLVIGLLFKYVP